MTDNRSRDMPFPAPPSMTFKPLGLLSAGDYYEKHKETSEVSSGILIVCAIRRFMVNDNIKSTSPHHPPSKYEIKENLPKRMTLPIQLKSLIVLDFGRIDQQRKSPIFVRQFRVPRNRGPIDQLSLVFKWIHHD